MTLTLRAWLKRKWVLATDPTLVRAYHVTFASLDGQRVLQHLLDNVYFKVYEGTDPVVALVHNARRSVIQDILENIDVGENPAKYNVPVQVEENGHAPR
jgi:hypothetical protein